MALMENELHKLHLRLLALEGDAKELAEHLKPSPKVAQHSDVKEPVDASTFAVGDSVSVKDGDKTLHGVITEIPETEGDVNPYIVVEWVENDVNKYGHFTVADLTLEKPAPAPVVIEGTPVPEAAIDAPLVPEEAK